MKRVSTPSIVLELPLKTLSSDEAIINRRFEGSRQIYNACLGESLRRYYLMKQSREYQLAKKMPKGKRKSNERKLKGIAFQMAIKKYGFTEYGISNYVTTLRKSYLGKLVGGSIAQVLSKRAFLATQKKLFGTTRRIRFKGKGQFNSIEGKCNTGGLIFHDETLHWSGLKIPVIIDPDNEYQRYALQKRVKYCRVIRRKINNRVRFYLNLILEGTPYQNPNHPIGSEEVGIDIGPSTIAYVGDTTAELKQFCPEINPDWKHIRRLQRKMDRSRRATNPDKYNANGTCKRKSKKNKSPWRKSKRYKKLQSDYANTNRKMTAHRKSLHGKLANDILSIGSNIKTEKLSYKAWQKLYGKSVLVRAPSMIVSLIQRKAENAHGHLHEIPTYTTKLSQTCHVCGEQVKKPLSQRWHKCCGIEVQRDLYSAFLAKCCDIDESNKGNYALDLTKARSQWCSLEPVLQDALSRAYQEKIRLTATGGNPVPASFGLGQSQSGSHHEPEKAFTKATNVVTRLGESRGEVDVTAGDLRL